MRRSTFLLVWLVTGASVSPPARGWMRPVYEDAVVVQRSELIVVGRLQKNSIECVSHPRKPGEGGSYEHRARLTVTEVLKGKCDRKEIPIIIHYGLTPVVGGYAKGDDFTIDLRGKDNKYPTDVIEVLDTGSSATDLCPLVKDARDANLWFLRRRSGTYGDQPGTGDPGIVDPEDLRPIELKDYFLAYLSENPEPQISKYFMTTSKTLLRAERYLDHLAVRRILEIQDVTHRLKGLKRYYLKRQSWNMRREARDAIVASGEASASFLLGMFDDPLLAEHRDDIILLFRETECRGALPKLVRLLESHRDFWRNARLYEGRWNHGRDAEDEQNRCRIHAEVCHAVYALRRIGDATAVPVVRETRHQWQQQGYQSDQIVEECDEFLRQFAEVKQ